MEQIVLLGGDSRMAAAAEALAQDGYPVRRLWMQGSPCPRDGALCSALRWADVLVLPVPAFASDGTVRTAPPGAGAAGAGRLPAQRLPGLRRRAARRRMDANGGLFNRRGVCSCQRGTCGVGG